MLRTESWSYLIIYYHVICIGFCSVVKLEMVGRATVADNLNLSTNGLHFFLACTIVWQLSRYK